AGVRALAPDAGQRRDADRDLPRRRGADLRRADGRAARGVDVATRRGRARGAAPLRRDLGRQLRATLLLADAAQAVEGKLYVLGGGWSVTGPQPVPMAIALKIDVPWDQANTRHSWRLELLDADG